MNTISNMIPDMISYMQNGNYSNLIARIFNLWLLLSNLHVVDRATGQTDMLDNNS